MISLVTEFFPSHYFWSFSCSSPDTAWSPPSRSPRSTYQFFNCTPSPWVSLQEPCRNGTEHGWKQSAYFVAVWRGFRAGNLRFELWADHLYFCLYFTFFYTFLKNSIFELSKRCHPFARCSRKSNLTHLTHFYSSESHVFWFCSSHVSGSFMDSLCSCHQSKDSICWRSIPTWHDHWDDW